MAAHNIEHFPAKTREKDVKLHVEAEQAQQEQANTQPASAVAVAYFGDHVERNHREGNQAFIDECEVTLCVRYSFRTVVKIQTYMPYAAIYSSI